ncbi:MAG: hypothetical protein ACAI34_20980, partial [Verrucomicrobium sp.]
MKSTILLPLLSAGACLVLANCETVNDPQQTIRQRNTGYSMDNPPSAQSRYAAPGTVSSSTTTVETSDPASMPVEASTTTSTTETVTTTPPEPSAPPVPPPPTTANSVGAPSAPQGAPTYGKMVPGRPGFVYPPGVDAKPENMVDVRDFTPGQKVRD